jgi:ATP-dependent Clp protease ATP-binding subunit ClpC
VKSIEVDTYLAHNFWQSIDSAYYKDSTNFMATLGQSLFSSAALGEVMMRLGISQTALAEKIKTVHLHIDNNFDSAYAFLFANLFMQAVDLEQAHIDEVTCFFVFAGSIWKQQLTELGVNTADIEGLKLWVRNNNRRTKYMLLWEKQSILKPKGTVNRAYTSRYAENLESYGEDYTKLAALGRFVLTIGRDQEMLDLIKVLQKDQGAAAMLVGDPGVGKTQFLKHLAVRMVVEDVPKRLRDKRLISFNFNKAFTQNQSLENFKTVLQSVLEEAAESRNIVLVLDDIDQMLNIRADLQAEIVNLLVSGIDKYKLPVVGTTSIEGYNRFIKPIRPLAALFVPVYLNEPNALISLQILIDAARELEAKYGVRVQVEALKQIVDLAPKFAYERVMPDKAIDLLEECLLEARDRRSTYLTRDIVEAVVSRKVGVKVGSISQSEAEVLMKLETKMHERVVGQDAAIKAIASALRRSRAGLAQGSKPISSFLFFGPTGVGKTEVARTLAEIYYGDQKLMTRIDMSEYQEEQNIQRLIGQNEGSKFVGGYLTEAVRQRPFSLVLLDEIEKANPKVLDLFLQILDEGHITDGAGRKVDFSNTIIIATSNAGSREIAELIGEGMKYDSVYEKVLPLLRHVFRVEFLNRFDKIIMFKPLLPAEVGQIAELMLGEINENLLTKGMNLEYAPQVVNDLVKLGYNPTYGAREVRRVIQEQVEDKIAEKVVSGELVGGRKIKFESLDNFAVV